MGQAAAPKLTEQLKQRVIIDNRPGSDITLCMALVAKALDYSETLPLGSLASKAVSPHLSAAAGTAGSGRV